MKLRRSILFAIALAIGHIACAQIQDTLKVEEHKVIDEVLASDSITPDKSKVVAIQEITKYGFKDLFKNYTYNPTIPYSQQVNPYAEGYMSEYLEAHTDYLKRLKKTATPYFNLIDDILSQYGLPHELKYLAVIESDLKSNALSIAGARGPWQFMPGTAREYGLRVGAEIDERTDYEKSTRAAAKYLLNLYKDLNDWLLVIAAYNGGTGRVQTAIRKSGSSDFWKLQYYLPQESRNHVKKFIATHFVMEDKKESDGSFYAKSNRVIDSLPDSLRATLDTVVISGRYSPQIIIAATGVDSALFCKINPRMDEVLASGDEYEMLLPAEKVSTFKNKQDEILNNSLNNLLNSVRESARPRYQREPRNDRPDTLLQSGQKEKKRPAAVRNQ
ncbi:MAG: lytic transglycosylase domain-containing protein [Chitinophagaceae bacterium]|nr:lytic transglycosylase domain-containing protein [Chitinophagaceae bacterium]